MNNTLSPTAGSFWRAGLIWLFVMAVSRFVIIAALDWMTGGKSFTDDLFHLEFLIEPWGIFTGTGQFPQSFPPLLPPLVYIIGKPLATVLNDFSVLRATYVIYELFAWVVLIDVLRGRKSSLRALHTAGAIWTIAPLLWMTDAVMMQEETISLLFVAMIIWAVDRRKLNLAIFLASLGVVAAKIFFLVPLLALAGYPPTRSFFRTYFVRGLIAAAPIALVYAAVHLITSAGSSVDSFSEFVPPVKQTTTIWALLDKWGWLAETTRDAAVLAKRVSAPFALAAGVTPLLWLYFKRPRVNDAQVLIALMGAMIMGVYSAFYHINPEYFVIMAPMLLVLLRPAAAMLWIVFGFGVAWAVNFTYGVHQAELSARGGGGGSKDSFVKIYHSIMPVPAGAAHTVCLILFITLSVGLAVHLFLLADRRARVLGADSSIR